MEAATSQESNLTSGVAASRSGLSALDAATTVPKLNGHLQELAKQSYLVFLHYSGRPPDAAAIPRIRDILKAAYADLESYYLLPSSPLAQHVKPGWKPFLGRFQEEFLPLYERTLEALDAYEQAVTILEKKTSPKLDQVSEVRSATEWKMECRKTLLEKLNLFQAMLEHLSDEGIEADVATS